MNKKTFLITASIIVLALIVSLTYNFINYRNYGSALPPKFPSDIPVIEGEITSSKKTLFEDGKGFVVDIDTKEQFYSVIDFYKTKLSGLDIKLTNSTEENIAVGEVYVGSKRIILEIIDKKNYSHVTISVNVSPK